MYPIWGEVTAVDVKDEGGEIGWIWSCGWGCSDWGFLTYEAAHDAYVEHRCDGVLEP